MSRTPVVVFAQVPPPEHGQSRMVRLGLEALRGDPERFEVLHINARFSATLEEIGGSSPAKLLLVCRYLMEAVATRFRVRTPLLYYIPGPVKWSAVLRDWLLLGVLRLFYRRVVFHWHAIGQGEWAWGARRLSLPGPALLDRVARAVSRILLARPHASIAVSPTSTRDSEAISARQRRVVCNGIEDPCRDYETAVRPRRIRRAAELADAPRFRLLFMSHGTAEKGLLDALAAMAIAMEKADPGWTFEVTFAGGVSAGARNDFDLAVAALRERWGERCRLRTQGYLDTEEKKAALIDHDIFLAPSRWESFGLTVAEAMAFGMAVVAAASDGVLGVLPPGYPFMGPVAEPRAFASNLLACCQALRGAGGAALGVPLRARFEERFRVEAFAKAYVEAMGRAAAGASGPAAAADGGGKVLIRVYLADQNPGYDRSIGISRMTESVMEAMIAGGQVRLETVASRSSQQGPGGAAAGIVLRWDTRSKWVRFLTDHLHPLLGRRGMGAVYYFPKGFLPWFCGRCRPSVVTIHDTIIQHDKDHYPDWRSRWEYGYWARVLRRTLRNADRILTISQSSRRQIEAFMDRYGIPRKEIHVTYEPCAYEDIPQPDYPGKEAYVLHLGSREPHKRTAQLVRWWHAAAQQGRNLPVLRLVGSYPPEVRDCLTEARWIERVPFLADKRLQETYRGAQAVVLSSEIEGFGLPALEAYYLGTPVCFVKGTSVEEVLAVATRKGGFNLEEPESLFAALEEVLAMTPEEVRECGLILRETYASSKVAEKMVRVFGEVAQG